MEGAFRPRAAGAAGRQEASVRMWQKRWGRRGRPGEGGSQAPPQSAVRPQNPQGGRTPPNPRPTLPPHNGGRREQAPAPK